MHQRCVTCSDCRQALVNIMANWNKLPGKAPGSVPLSLMGSICWCLWYCVYPNNGAKPQSTSPPGLISPCKGRVA